MAVNLYIEEIKKDKGPVPSFNTFYEFVQGDFREILEEKHYREKDFDLTNFSMYWLPTTGVVNTIIC